MTEHVIKLEDKHISVTKNYSAKGRKWSRSLRIDFDSVEDIPEELFALKISQSTNPSRTGKALFKYFRTYHVPEGEKNAVYSDTPFSEKVDIKTPLSKLKEAYVRYLAKNPELKVCVFIRATGNYLNIMLQDNLCALYDNNNLIGNGKGNVKDNPTIGDIPMWITRDLRADITLTYMDSKNEPGSFFYSIRLENQNLTMKDVFIPKREAIIPGMNTAQDVNPFKADIVNSNKADVDDMLDDLLDD